MVADGVRADWSRADTASVAVDQRRRLSRRTDTGCDESWRQTVPVVAGLPRRDSSGAGLRCRIPDSLSKRARRSRSRLGERPELQPRRIRPAAGPVFRVAAPTELCHAARAERRRLASDRHGPGRPGRGAAGRGVVPCARVDGHRRDRHHRGDVGLAARPNSRLSAGLPAADDPDSGDRPQPDRDSAAVRRLVVGRRVARLAPDSCAA